jgi:hypothetical protein
MEHGLNLGNVFGVAGNTDHHSGHPGSYGHGMTGVWTESKERNDIWEALYARRTWAMTGDAATLWFAIEDVMTGGFISLSEARKGSAQIAVDATTAIDYVELRCNGERTALWWELPEESAAGEAIVELELGWGERGKIARWEVDLALSDGEILEVIPRFRGPEVVSPLDASGQEIPTQGSVFSVSDNRHVHLSTYTWGNMTNSTPSTQGIALRVSSPASCTMEVVLNGQHERYAVAELLRGSVSGNLGPIDSPAYRVKALTPQHYRRSVEWDTRGISAGWANVRARLTNGHWVISSPVWIRE